MGEGPSKVGGDGLHPMLSGPIPSPAYLPNPGIEQGSPALQVDSLPTELSGKLYVPLC